LRRSEYPKPERNFKPHVFTFDGCCREYFFAALGPVYSLESSSSFPSLSAFLCTACPTVRLLRASVRPPLPRRPPASFLLSVFAVASRGPRIDQPLYISLFLPTAYDSPLEALRDFSFPRRSLLLKGTSCSPLSPSRYGP